jgi:hypothetical protein
MGAQATLFQERGVTKDMTKSKVWTKPHIKRLGEIKDVAGPGQTVLSQTSASKS